MAVPPVCPSFLSVDFVEHNKAYKSVIYIGIETVSFYCSFYVL